MTVRTNNVEAKSLKLALKTALRWAQRDKGHVLHGLWIRSDHRGVTVVATDSYVFGRFHLETLEPENFLAWIPLDEAKALADGLGATGRVNLRHQPEEPLTVAGDSFTRSVATKESPFEDVLAFESRFFDLDYRQEHCPVGFNTDFLRTLPKTRGTGSKCRFYQVAKHTLIVDWTNSPSERPEWEMAVMPLTNDTDDRQAQFRAITDQWKD